MTPRTTGRLQGKDPFPVLIKVSNTPKNQSSVSKLIFSLPTPATFTQHSANINRLKTSSNQIQIVPFLQKGHTSLKKIKCFAITASTQSYNIVRKASSNSINWLKTSSIQIKNAQKYKKTLIGIGGIGCLAVSTTTINLLNDKKLVVPSTNIPVTRTADESKTDSNIILPVPVWTNDEQTSVEQAESQALQEERKSQANLKAEQERQAAIQAQEEAAEAEQARLESARRERERQAAIQAEKERQDTIRARENAARAEQERQAAIEAEQARLEAARRERERQAALQKERERQAAIEALSKQQSPPPSKPKLHEPARNSTSSSGNVSQPWNTQAPVQSSSDELENVIRGNL